MDLLKYIYLITKLLLEQPIVKRERGFSKGTEICSKINSNGKGGRYTLTEKAVTAQSQQQPWLLSTTVLPTKGYRLKVKQMQQ